MSRHILKRTLQATGFLAGVGTLGTISFLRHPTFVPYDLSSPDLKTPVIQKFNPDANPPVVMDDCVRVVPLGQLRTADRAELTREFARGVWGGIGSLPVRRFFRKHGYGKPGTEDHLWETEDLKKSDYPVGTKMVDHFEVVERTDDKVVIRCGDSPLNQGRRPSDGLFTLQVETDNQNAYFHLKSIFFNSTPEGKLGGAFPGHMLQLHYLLDRMWIETAVRRLMK